jgi:Family of unknown function (DUF6084)
MNEEVGAAVEAEPVPFAGAPDPELEVMEARPVERAAAPTLAFRLRVTDASGRPIFAVALTAVITIEPAKRSHEPQERERLIELFGAPERWAATTTSFRWAQTGAMVGGFTGSTEFTLEIPCTYDLELAATKYFDGLADGQVPLRFHFNGTVIYEAADGAMQMVQLPWDRSTRFRMPVAVWRRMIEAHYPFRGWVPVHTETLERLRVRKAERGLPTFDATIEELLDEPG